MDLASTAIPPITDKLQWEERFPERHDLIIQVSLYAGELFFRNYELYHKTCAFLGIHSWEGRSKLHPVGPQPQRVNSWGKENRLGNPARGVGGGLEHLTFQKNPMEFLTRLVEARRRGMEIEQTHLGLLLRFKSLQKQDWKEMEHGDSEEEEGGEWGEAVEDEE